MNMKLSLEDATPAEIAAHVSKMESVESTAQTLRRCAEASLLEDSTAQSAQLTDELGDIRAQIELINSSEAWTPASVTIMASRVKAVAARCGLESINLGADQEALLNSSRLSLEDIDKVIAAVDSSSAALEERSVSALTELLNALADSIPKAYTRLCELKDRVNLLPDAPAGGQVSGPFIQRLQIDGNIPGQFPSVMNEFAQYGAVLLDAYSETAFQSVMKTTIFQDGLSHDSVMGYWDTVEGKVKQIEDPRVRLTETQMSSLLPGAGSLFGGADPDNTDVLTIRDKLRRFVSSFRPVSISDFSESLQLDATDSDTGTVAALTVSQIRDTSKYFCDLMCDVELKSLSASCKAAWIDASRTIRNVRAGLSDADNGLQTALGDDAQLVCAYLETLFILSAWPVLNYLTDLALTVNAFVDYAEASLKAEPAEQTPAEATVPEANVSEPAPSEDTAASDAADAAAATDTSVAELETTAKPTEPDQVPDTGETPDAPVDATGDQERAVVQDVEQTIETNGDDTSVDVSAQPEGESDTAVDVTGTDNPEEEKEEDKEAGEEQPAAEPTGT